MRNGLAFVGKKLLRFVLLLAAISIVSFWLVSKSPIDPVQAYIGADTMRVGPEQREQIAAYWGLDQPPLERFVRWASALVQGNMGTSMVYRQPVNDVIRERFASSAALMAMSWMLSGIAGFAAGVVAAMNRGKWIDRCIQWYCYALASTPTFWMGLLLVMVGSVWLGLFPVGLGTPAGVLAEQVTWLDRLHHMLLPAITLSIVGVSAVALHTRQKMLDVLDSEYVLFARARGERGMQLFWRHGLRNSILPAISLHFASFGELFGGAVLAERVFSYPGLGQATVEAGLRGDVPLLLGIVLCSAAFVFVGNVLADVAYRIADPRLREGREAV